MQKIISRIVRKLKLPKPDSHKGDNGRLLIIAGSEKYHGSLLYALKAASRIVDLIYVFSTPENQKLISKLKSQTAEFITVNPSWLSVTLSSKGEGNKVDSILVGPGMGESKRTYGLVKRVLKSGIKAVLDADALKVLDNHLRRYLRRSHILTPHAGEFREAFNMKVETQNVKKVIDKYRCTIVLKGKIDIVGNPEKGISLNYTGNQGMTKGGTGDVLAGLISALFCKNDAYTSAAAAAYVNGLAGDELYKKVGPYFDAEDLVGQIPKALWRILRA